MLNSEAHHYQFLFLGGILGEFLELPFVGNYLKENVAILKELGVEHVDFKTLSSLKSADSNSYELNELIESKYIKNKKKIILFCHSKACLEALHALEKDLLLFEKCVHRIICVQPPFLGSKLLKSGAVKKVSTIWPGLKSLTEGHYRSFYEEKIAANAAINQYLKERLLVVKGSSTRSRDVAWIIRPSHFLMKRFSGAKNDGLVGLQEQTIPNVEYAETQLEMDHSDLFTAGILSGKDNAFRTNVMRDLINSSVTSAWS